MEVIHKLKCSMPVIGKGKEKTRASRALPETEQAGWSLLALGLQKRHALIFKQAETELSNTGE